VAAKASHRHNRGACQTWPLPAGSHWRAIFYTRQLSGSTDEPGQERRIFECASCDYGSLWPQSGRRTRIHSWQGSIVLGQARDCAHERPGPRRQARALAEVASIALAGDWGPIRVKSGRVRCNGLCPLRAN